MMAPARARGRGRADALPLAAAELPGIAVQVACSETYLLEHARCLLASLRSVADAVDRSASVSVSPIVIVGQSAPYGSWNTY